MAIEVSSADSFLFEFGVSQCFVLVVIEERVAVQLFHEVNVQVFEELLIFFWAKLCSVFGNII